MEQDIFNLGTRIAQLVQCPTEMSLAILKGVRVPGAARTFSSTCTVDSLTVSVQSTSEIAVSICAHVKNPQRWQP